MPTDKSSKLLRFGTLGLLYFIQGAPYGFQTSCLPLILRQAGLSFTELGAMKLLFLPWICKPFYAPFVERSWSKKWWLIVSITLLGITCLMAGFFVKVENLVGMSILLFTFNLLAATQDISVDSLAIQALAPEELGAGNTIQVVGYKLGSVFAGGFLLWVEQVLGWSGMFVGFSSIYFVSILLIVRLHLVERSSNQKTNSQTENDEESTSVWSVFKVPGTYWMVCFVLFYKLCERAESIFSLYMVDKKVPMSQLAFWSTILRICSLLGSTYGGWALSGRAQTAPHKIILGFSLLRSFSIFIQLVLVTSWGEGPIDENGDLTSLDFFYVHSSFLMLCITLFSAGAITTAVFTLMMRLSQTAPSSIQGTHYTVLATSEVLGKLVFAILAGWLTDQLGLQVMYILFVILAVLNVPFILKRPNSVAKLCKVD